MTDNCELYPLVNKEPSECYVGLVKKHGNNNRSVINYIYAASKTPIIKQKMLDEGYLLNAQGEFSAEAVGKYFQIESILKELAYSTLNDEIKYGFKTNSGDYVNFTNIDEVYSKVDDFNKTNKIRIAYVVWTGDAFNVIIKDRNSANFKYLNEFNKLKTQWYNLLDKMKDFKINTDYIQQHALAIFNPIQILSFLNYLGVLQNIDNSQLSKNDIKNLLIIGHEVNSVDILLSRWSGYTIDEVALKIYDVFNNTNNAHVGTEFKNFLNHMLDGIKRYNDLKPFITLNNIKDKSKKQLDDKEDTAIYNFINELNSKYYIDTKVYEININKINSLSNAAMHAATILNKQLRTIIAQKGHTELATAINKEYNDLMLKIATNNYQSGLLNFISQGYKYALKILETIDEVTQQEYSDRFSSITAISGVLAKSKTLLDNYQMITNSIANLNSIVIEVTLSTSDKTVLEREARKLKNELDKISKKIENVSNNQMLEVVDFLTEGKGANGKTVADIVNIMDSDATVFDYLYKMGKLNNSLVSMMGLIIRDALGKRDEQLRLASVRIRTARENYINWCRLHNVKYDGTSFMYENIDGQYYIISDIDWAQYNEERKKEWGKLKKIYGDSKSYNFKQAMEKWEKEHTEERVVDKKTGRKERVPIYKKPLPALNEGLQEYYDTMMQLKGELGSLMPSYAQKQYLPPQLRKSWLDILVEGIETKTPVKIVAKQLFKKIQEWRKITPDDTLYSKNGTITDENGNLAYIMQSNFDGTPLKNIPLFYVHRLEHQDELLFDFDTALQHLASTVYNYDEINQIKDVVEMMNTHVSQLQLLLKQTGIKIVDMARAEGIAIIHKIFASKHQTLAASISAGIVDKYIYDKNLANKDSKWGLALRKLIALTTLRALPTNLIGGMTNWAVGKWLMFIQAGGKKYYNIKNLTKAEIKLFGQAEKVGDIMDILSLNKKSKAQLLIEMFDPINENYSNISHKRYYNSVFRTLIGSIDIYGMYHVGEALIHYLNMYAILDANRVVYTDEYGKKHNVAFDDALERVLTENGSYELRVKEGAKLLVPITDEFGNKIDKNGKRTSRASKIAYREEEITPETIAKLKKTIRQCNHECHGAMNDEDKGLIHRYNLGKAAMNFRQWMVEHYSRRYRLEHYNAETKLTDEGYYITLGKFTWELMRDMKHFFTHAAVTWNKLNDIQQSNIKQAITEIILSLILSLIVAGLSADDDDDDNNPLKRWLKRWCLLLAKRLMLDEAASMPIFIDTFGKKEEDKIPPISLPVQPIYKILLNPIAAVSTIENLTWPIVNFEKIDNEYQRGYRKGQNKYFWGVMDAWLPWYKQIYRQMTVDENNDLFNVFNLK